MKGLSTLLFLALKQFTISNFVCFKSSIQSWISNKVKFSELSENINLLKEINTRKLEKEPLLELETNLRTFSGDLNTRFATSI